MARKITAEQCVSYSSLGDSPSVKKLVESGVNTIVGQGICGKAVPAGMSQVVSGTDVTCHTPDSSRCPGFVNTDGS